MRLEVTFEATRNSLLSPFIKYKVLVIELLARLFSFIETALYNSQLYHKYQKLVAISLHKARYCYCDRANFHFHFIETDFSFILSTRS